MARNRKKMSLYEVISKTWPKPGSGGAVGRLHPEKTDKDEPIAAESAAQVAEKLTRWPKRPKAVQFNAGRIEISMPYQLAIALLLGVVLLVLVVFRLGQISQSIANSAEKVPASRQKAVGRASANIRPDLSAAPQDDKVAEKIAPMAASAEKVEAAEPKGNNRIVIQTYQLRAHLEPVKQYFARFGIETEIRKIDGWYYLVTKDKYENPQRPGSDGYLAKQRIIELGAKYKAPEGFESFGSRPFHDAYGMKFDN